MTREALIQDIINYAGDDYDSTDSRQTSFITSAVDDAIEEVFGTMCPFSLTDDDERDAYREEALNRYGSVIRRIAEFHYDKQGKEGVTTFYESGQTTSFETGGTPPSYLRTVIPIARVL